MLLGSWGNHVFYMISGFFLIPAALRHVGEQGYWRSQICSALRRVLAIVAAVALYWLICYLVSRFIIHIPAATIAYYWTIGIEFVWLYALFVLTVPFVAWVLHAVMQHRMACVIAAVVLIVVLVVTYVLNVRLALQSGVADESFGITDWRKWISAVTYIESFLVAGVVGVLAREVGGLWASRRVWLWGLVAVAAVTAVLFAVAVAFPRTGLLDILTFKSTSPLAFLLALCTVMAVALSGRKSETVSNHAEQSIAIVDQENAINQNDADNHAEQKTASAAHARRDRVILALASATLGFYIMQAATRDVWEPALLNLLNPLLSGGSWFAVVLWMLAIVLSSVAIWLLASVIDLIVRRPLFRALHLIK